VVARIHAAVEQMRGVLLTILVACGGTNQAPPVVSSPASSATPIVAGNPRPTCSDSSASCAVAMMEYFSNVMCACKDAACADQTNDEMTRWGTEMARLANRVHDEHPSPELVKRAGEIMTNYTGCMTKVREPAPSDPCAGSADPCGG